MMTDLAEKSHEDYVRWVYDGVARPWPVILYGVVQSLYRGVVWCVGCRRRRVGELP